MVGRSHACVPGIRRTCALRPAASLHDSACRSQTGCPMPSDSPGPQRVSSSCRPSVSLPVLLYHVDPSCHSLHNVSIAFASVRQIRYCLRMCHRRTFTTYLISCICCLEALCTLLLDVVVCITLGLGMTGNCVRAWERNLTKWIVHNSEYAAMQYM